MCDGNSAKVATSAEEAGSTTSFTLSNTRAFCIWYGSGCQFVYVEYLPLGMWKIPVESPSAFSYCELQNGRDHYPLPKFPLVQRPALTATVRTVLWLQFLASQCIVLITKSILGQNLVPVADKESSEKRQRATTGYRLFGMSFLILLLLKKLCHRLQRLVQWLSSSQFPLWMLNPMGIRNLQFSDFPSASCGPEKSSCLILPQESQSRQIRSCTKVHMQGIAVGRAVELTHLDSYKDLLCKLEEMFEIKGELCRLAKKWKVVYTDDGW
ncbi:hypothetical protein Vadar_008067 [Vaccinium darrowii]|uniref:Uncharacterized protein n=1 Tax=Vaccinium darrowii TaxID=229202 RepID=A0ACB7XPE3_9ERIC|nr:hypothetical protein Vadar_008067 [Vaccinium darrowii]